MANPAPSNAVLSVNDLEARYGVQTILDQATLAINEGDRIGLVGRNGTGKSTFLRIAAGVAEPDAGNVVRRRELVTGYLPQDFQLDDARPWRATSSTGAQPVLDLVAEYENGAADDARAGELLDHINHLDGWDVEHRVKALITHLDAPPPTARGQPLRRGKTPRRARARVVGQARPAHPRRADQPSRHRFHRMAGGFPQELPRHLPVRHARPVFPRPRGQPHRGTGRRHVHLAPGQLHRLPRSQGRPPRQRRGAGSRPTEVPQARTRMGPPRRARAHHEVRATAWTATTPSPARPAPEQELDVDLIIPPAPKLANRVIELKDARLRSARRPDAFRRSQPQPRTRPASRHRRTQRHGQDDPAQGHARPAAAHARRGADGHAHAGQLRRSGPRPARRGKDRVGRGRRGQRMGASSARSRFPSGAIWGGFCSPASR